MCVYFFFFFNDTATTEIYTLSLHDALPICRTGVTGLTRIMSDRRRAGRLVVPKQAAPADKMLLERSAIEELSHHADPWRVLRILSEFVEGFDALNDVGPAVTVFGSARTKPDDPYYAQGRALGAALAR